MTEERWISVVASGESSVAPDLAIVSFAVTGSGKELAPTRDDVNKRSSKVLASLRELGVAEGDLDAPDVSIHPEYDYRKGQRLTGYRVVRQMTAKVRDLDRLGDVLDWLVSADYKVTDDILVYASAATGSRPPGFNTIVSTRRQYGPTGEEELISYEGGIKADFFDRKLRSNFAIFYTDYKKVSTNRTGIVCLGEPGPTATWYPEIQVTVAATAR